MSTDVPTDQKSPYMVMELDSIPPCTLHLPLGRSNWVADSCFQGSAQIKESIAALFAGTGVEAIDVFGPAVSLPPYFHSQKGGNVSGNVGVRLRLPDGQERLALRLYSTMGGSPALQQADPASAWQIVNHALAAARKTLECKP